MTMKVEDFHLVNPRLVMKLHLVKVSNDEVKCRLPPSGDIRCTFFTSCDEHWILLVNEGRKLLEACNNRTLW